MPDKPPADGLNHVLQGGEWVGSVAIGYGFADWEKDVWKHPKNKTLRDKRKDPHVTAPGDVLFIPPWEEKKVDAATEQTHKFKLKTPTEQFRMRVLDEDGDPIKNADYTLELQYDPSGGVFKQKNKKTSGEGVVEETIPSTTTGGRLLIPQEHLSFDLDFGFLAPLDADDEKLRITGAQQRLRALGMYFGEVDGAESPETQDALLAFQKLCKANAGKGDNSITDPGELDGTLSKQTREALLKYYGC